MRRGLVLAALLLPLTGCYVAQPGPGYAQPGYPAAVGYGYAQPGYPPAAYDPYGNVYPGYSDNDGDPTLFVDGAVMPLVLFGGGWGYYDGRHNWHRAPDAVSHHLEQRGASGATLHPGGAGGFQQGRPEGGVGGYPQGRPEGRPLPAAAPYRAPTPYRPAEQGRPAPAHDDRQRGHDCPPGQRC
jgi:hypothetical protein